MLRIAHVSDIHILDWSSFSFQDLFSKRLVGAANLLFSRRKHHDPRLFFSLCEDLAHEKPDQIVLTGDVSNLSLPSEFQKVLDTLKHFAFDPKSLTMIPGNHDVYVKKAQDQRLFEHFFQDYATFDGKTQTDPVSFPFVRIRGPIALIGTSTAVPTKPFLANGMLGTHQLRSLKQILQEHASYFRVLLIHHPPIAYRKDILRGLRDKKQLQALLQEVGCELILHGHEHRDLLSFLDGPQGNIPVIGVGSGTYASARAEHRARYNIYTIEDHRLTHIETRVHDAKTNGFIPFLSNPHPLTI